MTFSDSSARLVFEFSLFNLIRTTCFCGETHNIYGLSINQSDCYFKCPGNQNQTCGGVWAMNTFRKQLISKYLLHLKFIKFTIKIHSLHIFKGVSLDCLSTAKIVLEPKICNLTIFPFSFKPKIQINFGDSEVESYRINSAFTPIIHFYRSSNLFNLSVTLDYDVFTVDFQKSVLIGN